MRITFISPFAGLNGGTRVVATYARVLTEQGHEVYILSAARSKRGKLREMWWQLTGRKHKIKKHKRNPLLKALGERHILYDPDKPFDPAIVPDGGAVFATWWRTAQTVAALPASKGKKFYLVQGYEVYPPHPPQDVIATYRLPLHKIAVSSWVRDKISKEHDVEGIDVVTNAVDAAQFQAPQRAKSDRMTIGFLYSKHAQKRVQMAIDAAMRARESIPDLRVIVFGAFQPSEQMPLPDWVEFHRAPKQEDIPVLYGSCDLWLFPSLQEGFGLPILEAMASRTPVLATPAGAAPDLIDGTNGILLPQDADAEAFCAQICAFAAMNNDEWQTYSEAAHRTAQRNDWPEAARRLAATIKVALETDETGQS